jgi:hypothetical protein
VPASGFTADCAARGYAFSSNHLFWRLTVDHPLGQRQGKGAH